MAAHQFADASSTWKEVRIDEMDRGITLFKCYYRPGRSALQRFTAFGILARYFEQPDLQEGLNRCDTEICLFALPS